VLLNYSLDAQLTDPRSLFKEKISSLALNLSVTKFITLQFYDFGHTAVFSSNRTHILLLESDLSPQQIFSKVCKEFGRT
jgi:hypothetical protein